MFPSFPSLLRHRRLFVLLTVRYRLSSSLRLFVFRLFLRYGSIPPLLCSEHHFSDLWLRYHSLTSSHSCGEQLFYCSSDLMILLYASTRVTFHFILRHSRHLFVLPVMSPSIPSLLRHRRLFLLLTVRYRLSLSLRLFVFHLFLRYGSIPPLLCSEHHFSDLWLRYHSLTSSHSCGWTISLLSSWSYDFIS